MFCHGLRCMKCGYEGFYLLGSYVDLDTVMDAMCGKCGRIESHKVCGH